ncbi:plasma kallikrein-like isoform X3 [Leptopilina boulardi]|uniref:plasma kallikrein-like isoform X3 n=1 Tax=Leptopilina boulardi TaxID=63433 RepID=UPI0021F60879|nr:plasma kallikrein-like isoform X3 [Leptopilina boulardi]
MKFLFGKACFLSIFLLGLKYQNVLAQNRIVGGSETRFPFMLYLQVGRKTGNVVSACDASIISNEWGLTAAHCFDSPETDYGKISVIAGTSDLKNLERTAEQHKVVMVIRNENYKINEKNRKIGGDIAVFKVNPPFNYNNFIQPVKLPQRGQGNTDFATVSGWGKIRPDGPGSSRLLGARVPKMNTENCKALYRSVGVIMKEGEVCYGFHNQTVTYDSCEGDSGGPLVNSDRVELGIVSWGVECGTKGYPGVYTDVIYFRDWIRQRTGI